MDENRIFTIGHWNVSAERFLEPLVANDIETLVDVRSLPGSRRSPWFDQEQMRVWLPEADIAYVHARDLGGRRRAQDVDPDLNAGWHNDSFHRYADYTTTQDYSAGLGALEELARQDRTAIMCGEPVPWRCHRSIISDSLTVRGWSVIHLMHGAAPIAHSLGRWGATPVVDGVGRITYPAELQPAPSGS